MGHPLLRRALEPFADRFVAGEEIETAMERARELNEAGIVPMLDRLGEHVTERAEAAAAAQHYVDLLHVIDGGDVEAQLSVKPTHLGLAVSRAAALENLSRVVGEAEERDVFVWLDMESSEHTDDTIALYEALFEEHANVGICIQAYLRRSLDDVKALVDAGAHVRLVKGAYDEDREIAYRDRDAVRRSFRACFDVLMAGEPWFAVGTHDDVLVEETKAKLEEHDREDVMFQFLMGVKEELQRELAREHTVGQYVPYGPEWLAYYWRRVRERRENLTFAVRAMLGR